MSAIQIPESRQIKSVPRSWMELLSNFAATWGRIDGAAFGLHCGKCGKDVQAHNAINSDVLKVSCGCQEYASERYGL